MKHAIKFGRFLGALLFGYVNVLRGSAVIALLSFAPEIAAYIGHPWAAPSWWRTVNLSLASLLAAYSAWEEQYDARTALQNKATTRRVPIRLDATIEEQVHFQGGARIRHRIVRAIVDNRGNSEPLEGVTVTTIAASEGVVFYEDHALQVTGDVGNHVGTRSIAPGAKAKFDVLNEDWMDVTSQRWITYAVQALQKPAGSAFSSPSSMRWDRELNLKNGTFVTLKAHASNALPSAELRLFVTNATDGRMRVTQKSQAEPG